VQKADTYANSSVLLVPISLAFEAKVVTWTQHTIFMFARPPLTRHLKGGFLGIDLGEWPHVREPIDI